MKFISGSLANSHKYTQFVRKSETQQRKYKTQQRNSADVQHNICYN